MNTPAHIKGLRIRTVNLIMLSLSLLLFAVVLYTTVIISSEYDATLKAMNNYMEWENATREMQAGSDYLTDQAKLYASTAEKKYADNYFHELYTTRSREKALEKLTEHNLHSDHDEHDCALKKALNLSNALAHKEIYAMRLVAEGANQDLADFPASLRDIRLSAEDRLLNDADKIARARKIMFNTDYQDSKDEILATLESFFDENNTRLRNEQETQTKRLGKMLSRERLLLIVLCVLNVMTFAMIIVLIVRPLKIYLKCIQNDTMLEAVGAYEFKHLAFTYNNIFTLKEHHDKILKHKAEHDPLTGLLNRSAFDSLSQMLKANTTPVGLLLIDVDKFKQINDTYGHLIGDKALCRVAEFLQNNFRADDFCIRVGGDEFAVIFNAHVASIENIITGKIHSINDALQRPYDEVPPLSISVGGAISQSGFTDALYKQADIALYKVKEAGRRGCRFYHPGDEPPKDQDK